MIYRIKNWEKNFEVAQSKKVPKHISWVAMPNHHDGNSFLELLDHAAGLAHYGCWVLIVQIASKCQPRGTLISSAGRPHDSRSLARIVRGDPNTFAEAIKRLLAIGWLEVIQEKESAPIILGEQSERSILQTDIQDIHTSTATPQSAEKPKENGNGKEPTIDGHVFKQIRLLLEPTEKEMGQIAGQIYAACGKKWNSHSIGALFFAHDKTPRPRDWITFAAACLKKHGIPDQFARRGTLMLENARQAVAMEKEMAAT